MPVNLTTQEKNVEAPELLELRGDLLIALCTQPLPPGSRIELHFNVPEQDNPAIVAGKVVSINPAPENRFKIAVRTNSVTKETKTVLESLL